MLNCWLFTLALASVRWNMMFQSCEWVSTVCINVLCCWPPMIFWFYLELKLSAAFPAINFRWAPALEFWSQYTVKTICPDIIFQQLFAVAICNSTATRLQRTGNTVCVYSCSQLGILVSISCTHLTFAKCETRACTKLVFRGRKLSIVLFSIFPFLLHSGNELAQVRLQDKNPEARLPWDFKFALIVFSCVFQIFQCPKAILSA